MEDKQRLRTELLAARRARSAHDLDAARAAIREHLRERTSRLGCVAAYVPLRTEPGSVELLAQLVTAGTRVLVPVTLADRDLDWVTWTPTGVGHPVGLDAIAGAHLVLAPALAVAPDGTRLGRGGGSYDRALSRVPAEVPVAALLFDDELRSELPREPWDVPVSAVVTPSGGWHDLGRRNTGVGADR